MTTPKTEIVLVMGGARSGKSTWALRYVERHYRSRLFLATARILDDEMAQRIRLHQEARGPEWRLVEEPLDLAGALEGRCKGADAVLVDCLTVWLSNVMLEKGDAGPAAHRKRLSKVLEPRSRSMIFVSNEVGMGIVPEHPLGRKFRDEAGALNQEMADMADRVVFLVAGLPLWLKGKDEEDEMEKAGNGVIRTESIELSADMSDMPADELWKILEAVPEDILFVERFNDLEEPKRREVAEYVLTTCSVFSGRPALFSSGYDADTALLKV